MGEVKVVITTDSKGGITGISDFENKISSSFRNIQSESGSLASKIKDHWVAITAGLATFSGVGIFLKDSIAQAYEADIAFNKLRIQVEGLGINYADVKGKIEDVTAASAKYAIVQDEDVARTLQQLTFFTGDLTGSMKNLNLIYDLAYQKGISTEESANLVGKAFTGNVEMLGRYIPELRNLDNTLGANSTAAQKAAYAMALLEEKSAGALGKMTEHEKSVREISKAWEDFKEIVGGIAIQKISNIMDVLGLKRDKSDDLTSADINYSKKKKTTDQIAAETKAINDSIEAAKKRYEEEDKMSDAVEKWHQKIEQLNPALSQSAKEVAGLWDEFHNANAELEKMKNLTDAQKSAFRAAFSADLFKGLDYLTDQQRFDKMKDSVTKSLEQEKKLHDVQLGNLKTLRDAYIETYNTAISKMDEARNKADDFRSGAGEIGSFLTGFNAGPKTFESERDRIKELLSASWEMNDKSSLMNVFNQTSGFMEQNRGAKDAFGFNMDFGDMTQGLKDLEWRMTNLGDAAEREGNMWSTYSNNAINAIYGIDSQMSGIQDRLTGIDIQLSTVKELKIETSGAMTALEAIEQKITAVQIMMSSVNTGPGFKSFVKDIQIQMQDNAEYGRGGKFMDTGAEVFE